MTLRGKVVNLIRCSLLNYAYQARRIGHVSVMEDESLMRFMGVLKDMIDARSVEE